MSRLRKIYWFAFYDTFSPSVRYRGLYPLQYFKEEKNIEYQIIYPGYSIKRIFDFSKAILSILFTSQKGKVVIIQKLQSNYIYARLLKLIIHLPQVKVFYDIDDADYLIQNGSRIYDFVRKVDAVTAGSLSIVDHLKPINNNTFLLTSPIVDLRKIKAKKNNEYTIGWIGEFGGEHKELLWKQVFPAIKSLSFQIHLIILGVTGFEDEKSIRDYYNSNKNIKLSIPRKINWDNEIEIQDWILKFDVGIATLKDSTFQKSKSGIKVKQYFNNGIPVLSSNLPENNLIVEHDTNGYLCNNQKDFEKYIIKVYNMGQNEFERLSKGARKSISQFDHQYYYNRLNQIYDDITTPYKS